MKAIAMKATQEDWDSVKDLVKNNHIIMNFNMYRYLVTNFSGKMGLVTNVLATDNHRYNRELYETFDRAIFLDALDIVEEKILKGSELQMKVDGVWYDCKDHNEYRLKPINPEVKQLQELAEKLGYKIEKL